MMEFLDRVEELKRVREFLALKEGAFACLYGRRRVGKSRLLKEASAGRTDVVMHIADKSDQVLQRGRLARDLSRLIPGFDRVDYPDWGALLERWVADAPRGSVLVLDEFPYLVERTPALPSVVQRILEGIGPTGLKLIICGSSQRMMQGLVLDESEPLYGRAREIIRLQPIGFEWMKRAFPSLSPRSRLEHYAVWGGVPRYWELSQGERSLIQTLRRQVFSPLGVLRNEPAYLLLDNLKGSIQASSILALVGMGAHRLSEIASRLQVPTTALSGPIRRLVELGLVRKETPFGCDAKGNKRSLYKVSDSFLDFWYRFVLPNYSDEGYLEDVADHDEFRHGFDVYLGCAWEQLVRESIPLRKVPGVSGRLRRASRWWGNGIDGSAMELDVVAETSDGKTLLVGECKLALSAREARHEQDDLQRKAECLPFVKDYSRVVCQLFVAFDPPSGALSIPWAEGD